MLMKTKKLINEAIYFEMNKLHKASSGKGPHFAFLPCYRDVSEKMALAKRKPCP
jgi:hypothetical protein